MDHQYIDLLSDGFALRETSGFGNTVELHSFIVHGQKNHNLTCMAHSPSNINN